MAQSGGAADDQRQVAVAEGEVGQAVGEGFVQRGAGAGEMLALWQTAVNRAWLPEQILPAPALVWQSGAELWQSGELLLHLSASAARIGWSLLIGGGAGLMLGFALGLSRGLRAYLGPSFDIVAQFPVLGWVPLLIIFAGIDEALKIAAVSIAAAVPVAINVRKGVDNIAANLFDVTRVLGFSPWQRLRWLVLPAVVPSLFTGLRQAAMQAWLTLVFVELLASSEGIGYLMVWGRQLAQLDLVIVGMLLIGAVGLAIDLVLRTLEQRFVLWRRSAF